jgi:lipopolysaccharide transport system permease protein
MAEIGTQDRPPSGASSAGAAVHIINGRAGWEPVDLPELWRFRELLWVFVWRDLKVRYKQTLLGVAWVALQPLSMTGIYTVFFGYVAKLSSDGVPYPVFLLSGIVLWQFFSRAVLEGSISLVAQQNLITKTYFPRLIAPLAPTVSGLVDLVIMFVILLGALLLFRVTPAATIVLAPVFILMAAALALAVSVWLSVLDAHYRDVRHTLSFLLQIWYFASPIVYSPSLVPEAWRPLYLLNPASPIIQGFRWSILGDVPAPELWSILVALLTTAAALGSGVAVFHRAARNIVDRI